jgi:hypothetical protein
MVLNLEGYNVFQAFKRFGQGMAGGIAVCKSNRYPKIQWVIKISAPRSYHGFYIKLVYFAVQHLVADV